MEQAIARGDVAEIQALLDATGDSLSPGMKQAAQIAIDNESTTAGGAKSACELAKHLKDVASGDDEVQALKEALEEAPQKAKDAIQDALDEAIKFIKGHLKEIGQKWPSK